MWNGLLWRMGLPHAVGVEILMTRVCLVRNRVNSVYCTRNDPCTIDLEVLRTGSVSDFQSYVEMPLSGHIGISAGTIFPCTCWKGSQRKQYLCKYDQDSKFSMLITGNTT